MFVLECSRMFCNILEGSGTFDRDLSPVDSLVDSLVIHFSLNFCTVVDVWFGISNLDLSLNNSLAVSLFVVFCSETFFVGLCLL